jgi:hypothetical protein
VTILSFSYISWLSYNIIYYNIINMSKCKRGGSLASDAVTDLVSTEAFDKMSLNASNAMSGGKRSSHNHKPNVVCMKCAKLISGGAVLSPAPTALLKTMHSYSPSPSPSPVDRPTFSDTKYASYGGRSSSRRTIKNINEYKSQYPFKLYNGRGGSANSDPIHIGLRTDASITSYDKTQGAYQNRVADATALKVLAHEEISGPIQMNKTSHYGDVTGVAEHGKARAAPKKPTKKPVKPKKPTRKPAAKK